MTYYYFIALNSITGNTAEVDPCDTNGNETESETLEEKINCVQEFGSV